MIYINFCVDWEGEHFKNLRDLQYLLAKMENIPVTHFICPAYFYHFPKNAEKKILDVIRPQDEIGLHIHCYKSLIRSIGGVTFRTENNYFRQNDPLIQIREKILQLLPMQTRTKILNKLVSGRGVPLSVYPYQEIKQIIEHSKELLEKKLCVNEILSFRAGGWIASDDVIKVLFESGFEIDSSAVAPEILSNGYEKDFIGINRDDFNESYPVFVNYIKALWGVEKQESGFLKNINIHSSMPSKYISRKEQPFKINSIIEMPNNCGATDFASMEKTFLPTLNWALGKNRKYKNKHPFFLNITCHQEGDFIYKKGIFDFYKHIQDIRSEEIRFDTVRNSAEIYKISLDPFANTSS